MLPVKVSVGPPLGAMVGIGSRVAVAVGPGIGVFVSVAVGVGIDVGAAVAVGADVDVCVAVGRTGVWVAVGPPGVLVAAEVGVLVDVGRGVDVLVAVGRAVGVVVDVGTAVGVLVAVGMAVGVVVDMVASGAATGSKENVRPLTVPPIRVRWTKGVMGVNGADTVTVIPSLLATASDVLVTGHVTTCCRQTLTCICEASIPPCDSFLVALMTSATVMK